MKIKVGEITKATTKVKENVRLSNDGFLNLRYITSAGKEGLAMNLYRPMFWFKDSAEICPAIILSSNPLLKNKETKPWEDDINLLEGKVHYYGDNKTPGQDPSANISKMPQTGNNKLISLIDYYLNDLKEKRELAPPIVIFQHCKVDQVTKGFRKFIGVGYIYNYELVEQQTAKGEMFSNYRYDINLIKLDDNQFDWQWISDRRNPVGTALERNSKAPNSWKNWIRDGHETSIRSNDYDNLDIQFDKEVTNLLSKGKIEKPLGNKTPNSTISIVKQFQRDPWVKAWVLQNSKGKCEACNTKAPFQMENGQFYLEVHHIKQLAFSGSDRIENAVALCPNCHREIHFGSNRKKIEQTLYQSVSRLEKEI